MKARARLLGHSIHQMLIMFPLGLFLTAVVFDVVHLILGGTASSLVAFWMIGAGVIGGLCPAVFGAIDWRGIPRGTRADRLGRCTVSAMFVSWDCSR